MLKSLNGVEVEVPKRMMHTAKEVFFTDDYRLDRIKNQVLAITESPIIVDVGANVGYLSAFVFTRFPNAKVISVEPIPKNLSLLHRNRDLNSSRDWSVMAGVLSGKDGEVDIQYDANDSFTTSASMFGLDSGKDSLTVRSQALASLMKERNIPKIHVLKLDCEGAEYDILYALSKMELNSIAFISMETHLVDDERNNKQELTSWLVGNGWKVDVIRSKVLATNPNFAA